jgi:hypothetical protein
MNPHALSTLFFLAGLFGVIGLFSYPIILWGIRHDRLRREMEHAERMKALEVGRDWPADARDPIAVAVQAQSSARRPADPAWSLARKCVSLAFWLPVGVFLVTQGRGNHFGIWGGTALIASTSLVCATTLVLRRSATGQRPAAAPYQANGKAAYDPDAFDVVGRRG